MMSLSFNRLYVLSYDQKIPFWSETLSLEHPDQIESIFKYFELEMTFCGPNLELMIEKTIAFLGDLSENKAINPRLSIEIEFIHFFAASIVAMQNMSAKLLNNCFDWVCNAISEEVTTAKERDYKPYWINAFIRSQNTFVQKHFAEAFIYWSTVLFYYDRSTGGLQQLALIYLSEYLSLLFNIAATQFKREQVMALSQVSSWCEQHGKVEEQRKICSKLYNIYEEQTQPEVKKDVAFFMSGLKLNYTPKTKKEWIDIIEQQYYSLLNAHEPLQIVMNKYSNCLQCLIDNFGEIEIAIDQYHTFLDKLNLDDIALSYELSRMYSLLFNTLVNLIRNGKVSVANMFITRYFRIPIKNAVSNSNVYIIPNTAEGPLYCFNNSLISTKNESNEQLLGIIRIGNEFLGLAESFNDCLDFELKNPPRLGAPNYTLGNQYYKLVSEYLDVSSMLKYPDIRTCSGLILWYGSTLPIQPLIAKELGLTIPIVQSFYDPQPIRSIKKIFIWQGETNLSEIECIGIKKIFEQKNVDVTLLNAATSTKQDFLSHFLDIKYDLIWISCHGEFQHYEVHKSNLDLGCGITITVPELQSYKYRADHRRLLVLGACDGATTALFNSPSAIGIGSSMVSDCQSLISHTWPVDNYAGLIHGILLGIFLMQEYDYKTAHQLTLRSFLDGKQKVLDIVRQHCAVQEVIERIENTNIDFDNFYYWGSLTYIE